MFVVLVVCLLSLFISSINCACTCSTVKANDGSTYNLCGLEPLGVQGPHYGTSGQTYQYKFEVCGSGFNCGTEACSGSTLGGACQSWAPFWQNSGQEACTGAAVPSNFQGKPGGAGLSFQLKNGDQHVGQGRFTDIIANCKSGVKGISNVVVDDSMASDLEFVVTFDSEEACPGKGGSGGSSGLSPGSILLIVLVILIPIYIVGGIIFNKVRGGATGLEMLPNYEFWKSLPGLVKDGACCMIGRRPGSYSQV